MPQPIKHLLPRIILLLGGLAILAALSIGAEQTIMEVKPPESCFHHTPPFSYFQIRHNGEVVYEKTVGRNQATNLTATDLVSLRTNVISQAIHRLAPAR